MTFPSRDSPHPNKVIRGIVGRPTRHRHKGQVVMWADWWKNSLKKSACNVSQRSRKTRSSRVVLPPFAHNYVKKAGVKFSHADSRDVFGVFRGIGRSAAVRQYQSKRSALFISEMHCLFCDLQAAPKRNWAHTKHSTWKSSKSKSRWNTYQEWLLECPRNETSVSCAVRCKGSCICQKRDNRQPRV